MSVRNQEAQSAVDVSEKIFSNAPNMFMLCLTVIGLIKIYTRFEKITTLADNFLSFVSIGFLVATIISYIALRSPISALRARLAQIADLLFLVSLTFTGVVVMFITFSLAG